MKHLIIGLGSMGKRRIRNLHYLSEKDIVGFDISKERRKEAEDKYNIKTVSKLDMDKADVIFICTPPNLHIEYELEAARKGKHFFCEASIFTKGYKELIKLCKDKNFVAAPSCTFRFVESIRKVKSLIDEEVIGKVCVVTYHMGQWLKDWHVNEDVLKFYVGQRETSATREMVPFEFEWLTWIFGDINRLRGIRDKVSDLQVDIEDVCQTVFQFDSGVIGNMLIEVISRTPTRLLRVVGDKGTIEWDWSKELVRVYTVKDKKWKEYYEKEKPIIEENYCCKENIYIDEVKHFLNAVRGEEEYMYSLEDDLKVLSLSEVK